MYPLKVWWPVYCLWLGLCLLGCGASASPPPTSAPPPTRTPMFRVPPGEVYVAEWDAPPADGGEHAGSRGRLALHEGCLTIEFNGRHTLVIWQQDAVRLTEAGQVTVTATDNPQQTFGLGDEVVMMGGYLDSQPIADTYLRQPIPRVCRTLESVFAMWWVGAERPLAGRRRTPTPTPGPSPTPQPRLSVTEGEVYVPIWSRPPVDEGEQEIGWGTLAVQEGCLTFEYNGLHTLVIWPPEAVFLTEAGELAVVMTDTPQSTFSLGDNIVLIGGYRESQAINEADLHQPIPEACRALGDPLVMWWAGTRVPAGGRKTPTPHAESIERVETEN